MRKKRFCLTLDLKDDPDLIKEYLYWHKSENIWPEIPEGIRAVGIETMEIYRMGNHLFMLLEGGPDFDFERDMALLASLPRQMEWESFTSRFQVSVPGSTSSEKWKLMEPVFSL
ncbi:MAG: L-rhamnose mutarotase [Bacteroidales bacterium]|nr:L-rhamnose mutarotase [Bacteroidales bacterium]HNW74021.1 L-rhamnose mutarotase [Bacteroidales bacterium]HPS50159.1 L-rhamnose mutarotase [Bacteroidales bacterium]